MTYRPKRQGAARRYAPLIAVGGLILVIIAGALVAQPGMGLFRHSDPSQARDSLPSPIDMALMYASIAGSISGEDFSNASALLGKLDGAYIPDSVRYTFARFNTLLSSQISELNITDTQIAEALGYARVGMTAEALSGVTNATWTIARANLTWSDLSGAAGELSSQFKMRQLTPELDLIMGVIERYFTEADEVIDTIGEIDTGNLTRTKITLNVGTGELIVGEKTWAAGELTMVNGTTIAGMPVSVNFGGRTIGTTTGPDGSYNVTLTAAGYEENAAVSAAFLSRGGYAGCTSVEETILVNFIMPTLTVNLDRGLALPGQAFTTTIHMELSEWAHANFSASLPEAEGAQIRVTAFGQTSTAYVQDGSNADLQFTVPLGTASGSSPIAASVIPEGFVGPASGADHITVYRLTPTVSIEAPQYAIGGMPFQVSGAIWANGTWLANATVDMRVRFAGGTTVYCEGTTDGSGRFSVPVPTGALTQTGTAMVEADIYPAEDIYSDGHGGANCYVISPLAIAIPFAALGALAGGIALTRSRRVKGQYSEAGGTVAVAMLPRQIPLEGTIAGAYARAASWVGSALKRRIKPSDTAREYYAKVSPSLGEAREPFRDLTLMLEESLYGLKEASIPASRGLLGRIRELLGMGSQELKR